MLGAVLALTVDICSIPVKSFYITFDDEDGSIRLARRYQLHSSAISGIKNHRLIYWKLLTAVYEGFGTHL